MRNVLKRRHYTEEIAWHCLKEKFRKKSARRLREMCQNCGALSQHDVD